LGVGQQRGPDARVGRTVLQDPGLDVEGFGRDAQPLGDLLQDVRARLAQAALDLAQVGVGHPGRLGQLAHRDPVLLPLLPDVLADRVDVHVTHALSVPPSACNCKPSASTHGATVSRALGSAPIPHSRTFRPGSPRSEFNGCGNLPVLFGRLPHSLTRWGASGWGWTGGCGLRRGAWAGAGPSGPGPAA